MNTRLSQYENFPVRFSPKDLPKLYETVPTEEAVERLFIWLKFLGPERDLLGIDYNKVAEWVFGFYDYDTPLENFTPVRYKKFYDWFLRELSPQTKVAARYRASFSRVCSPVEALIRYRGKVGDGTIELKNGRANILNALRYSVPEVGEYNFLKLNLRKCFYHRVHSPVNGVVSDITLHPQGTGAFGDNSVTCVTIDAPKPVFLCAIGERTVQSFNCVPKVGDELNKLDEVGWFWWGSMVLLAVPPEMKFSENLPEKLFVGDPLLGE